MGAVFVLGHTMQHEGLPFPTRDWTCTPAGEVGAWSFNHWTAQVQSQGLGNSGFWYVFSYLAVPGLCWGFLVETCGIFSFSFSFFFSFSIWALVAHTIKNLPAMWETRVRSWVRKMPCRREWQKKKKGNGNPLQYFCLENSTHRRAWWAIAHGVT